MTRRHAVALFPAVLVLAGSPFAAAQLHGTVQQRSFLGPVTQRTVSFNIYLPEGYAASTRRYPVIYHLHGLGGNQGGPQNTTVPASFEAALAQGVIGPVIIVFPNGYTDAWWADSVDGAKPAEIDVAQQLIPYVDQEFRTIAARESRVIEGFSMGGFGATKFFAKYPELFATCVEYDGALVTWANMLAFHPELAASIFGNSEAYFNQYSPWSWSAANAPALRARGGVRMVVGALGPGNRSFRDYLLGLDAPVDYVETACAHELGCLLSAQGLASAAFIASRLQQCECGANCDCSTVAPALNTLDFNCFLNRFATHSPLANCDGSTTAPVLNVLDFSCFLNRFAQGCP
jgi:S-formylglutathione hydrolase FrmB